MDTVEKVRIHEIEVIFTTCCFIRIDWKRFQVKVKNWVNGVEGETVVGLTASFGAPVPSQETEALRLPAVMADPFSCCSKSSSKVNIFLYLNCT